MKTEECISMDYNEIISFLPHRYPFLLVDKVINFVINEKIHAIKCVSALEPFFLGHFPNNPVMPGVLQVEGLAQAGALLMMKTFAENKKNIEQKCILTGIEDVRFRQQVIPGDVLHYHVKYERGRGSFLWFSGTATVNNEICAEAKFSARFFDK